MSRLEVWESRTTKPLLVAALVFVVLLAYPIIEPHPTTTEEAVVRTLNVGIWLAFAVDYAVRLRLAEDRRRFVRTHLPDLAIIVLPALRPLRLLRLLSIARVLAGRSQKILIGNVIQLVSGAAALLLFAAAVGTLNFERPAKGANITTFGDALWWSTTTITTVGYGDRYPVTVQGRIIAAALMVVGIALLGILTATIAAWFVQRVSREDEIEDDLADDRAMLVEIRDRLRMIEARLDAKEG